MEKSLAVCRGILVVLLLAGMALAGCAKPAPTPAPSPTKPAVPAPSPVAKGDWPKAVSWVGSTAGGTYTVMGAAMCRMIEKYTGVTAGCEATGGGVQGILSLHKKEMDFSTNVVTDVYDAPRGLGNYKQVGPVNVCALFAQHHFLFTGIVRADSKIYSPADWRGKRLMCKNPTSAIFFRFAEGILAAYGMSASDVIVQPVPGDKDRIVAMSEKTTDVLIGPYTEATPYLIELFERVPCSFIPLDGDKLDSMIKKDPVWYKGKMPAGCYKGQDKDILMAGIDIVAVCRYDLPESFVYEVMKAIWDHFDNELKPMHPEFKNFDGGLLVHKSTFPFHPGAVRYWKEKGIWDEAAQKRQDGLLKELRALGAKY